MKATRGWRGYAALVLLGFCLVLPLLIAARSRKRSLRRKTPPVPVQVVDFTRDVLPILQARCCRCHGPRVAKVGLRLDSPEAIRKGSSSGAVIVPGDGSSSLLVTVLTGVEDTARMPPSGKPLDADQIARIRAWIDAGAPGSAGTQASASVTASTPHWAFLPPRSPAIPAAPGASNPIDAFLAAELGKHGIVPGPHAPPAVLLRRLHLDLIGLPPLQEEVRAFLADPSETAYERIVDRLLANPAHGERWGRHWMDVWRYSDPDGRKAKNDIWWGNAHIWRWRDWIVTSVNADKGYDQLLREMLAGDEIAPGDPHTLAATGYLVRNWFKLNRTIWLNQTIEHTGKAFLGLTLQCARCHDHKFDPISQKDYYRFRAFFEPHDIRTTPMNLPGEGRVPVAHARDVHLGEPTWIFVRGDEKTPDRSVRIHPGVPAALQGAPLRLEPIVDPTSQKVTSSGRRLALARWITDRGNPLAARVAVNHIWARHFGRPLVDSVADWGLRCRPPVHQALLDWLAVAFMERGWSMKWLHRLIVTSAAYRRHSSRAGLDHRLERLDPDNRLLARMNSRRMEAEVVRDSLLWLAGVLDRSVGGPPIDHGRGTGTSRRSLYYRYSREDRMLFLTTFDSPAVEECYLRQESILPQQALALENSAFVWDQARRIVRQLEAAPTSRAFVEAGFEQVLGRPPRPGEMEACLRFLAQQEQLLAQPGRLSPFPPPPPPAPVDPEVARKVPGLPLVLGTARDLPATSPASAPAAQAREYLIHALLNHNDFITIR